VELMFIPPKYTLTKKIVKLLQDIERLKTKFDLLPKDKFQEKYFRQKSILKSALYSARIEGNPKTLKEISLQTIRKSKEKTKIELNNLYKGVNFILKNSWKKDLTLVDLRKFHKLVLKNLSYKAGSLRVESSATFNQAGVGVYVCPMPKEIKPLLAKWLRFVNGKNESFIPIKSALSHYSFEKIHPFLDGNGRVGRLLVHLILKKYDYDLRGQAAFEEYLDKHREVYYRFLNIKKKNITLFVEFFLKSLKVSLQKAVKVRRSRSVKGKPLLERSLPPRRYEVLQIIKDHKQVFFDFLHRRFMAVSPRVLRYDLKKLQDSGFIRKRGVTRGVVYEAK